jgi:hypothetical protein
MDSATIKEKFAELTQLYNEVVKASRSGDKATAQSKWAERNAKVAEFKAMKAALR